MSTTAGTAQPKASTLATRAQLTSDTPTQLPPSNASSANPTPTTNYAQAAAQAASIPSKAVTKTQSWKLSDLKGQKQGEAVEGKGTGMGYSCTGK